MPRTTPRDPPPTDAVAATVGRCLDARAVTCDPFANGLNAVSRIVFADTPPVVAKLATFSTGTELQVEGRLLERLATAGAPVPTHFGTLPPADHDLLVAVLVTAFVPGRTFNPDGDRYTAYRLCAHARRATRIDYWAQFAPESDPAAVASRLR